MNNFDSTIVSFFNNLREKSPTFSIELLKIIEGIQNGKWQLQVEKCRENLAFKKELPAFTPTGIFKQRNTDGIELYSRVICLDFDNIDNPNEIKEKCVLIPWIWVAFITPSGKGLKILVQTIDNLNNYKLTEEKIAKSFYELTGLIRDERSKDLARLQFVSFDKNLYINKTPTIYQ